MASSPASTASSDLYETLKHPQGESKPCLTSSTNSPSGDGRSNGRNTYHAAGHPLPQHEELPGLSRLSFHNTTFIALHEKRKRDSKDEICHDIYASSPVNGTASDIHKPSRLTEELLIGSREHKRPKAETDEAKSASSDRRPPSLPILPDALWQRILCYVPPVFLGRLLGVNHAFHRYLTPKGTENKLSSHPNSSIKPLGANAIWVASRRRFCPGIPRPIHGMDELAMWRLLRGRGCQICGKPEIVRHRSDLSDDWDAGPGDAGVSIVWPFGVRCCGLCMQNVSRKEIDLSLFWDSPFFLLQALPFAFVTDQNHTIGHYAMQNNITSSSVRISKQYYKPHLEDIKERLKHAKGLGAASAEEWAKGLALEGQERIDELIRWEKWVAKGGLKKVNAPPPSKSKIRSVMSAEKIVSSTLIKDSRAQNIPRSQASGGDYSGTPISLGFPHVSVYPQAIAPFNPAQNGRQPHYNQSRPERNIWDVHKAKAVRRVEIERRCGALNPPILPNVLVHMDSFQAALQISQPMTDTAWELLRPRLLAQLPYAERCEKERVQQAQLLNEEYERRWQQQAELKDSKENLDYEWEVSQAPIREKLGFLADHVIRSRWSNGSTIDKENCPKFAADVLVKVREHFYADLAKNDKAAQNISGVTGSDIPSASSSANLILENMKWVFDTKIKPLTDHLQKELFLCHSCGGNFKLYAFEGMIQHFAAKHTTVLSMGNVVVHWRSEWPEYPPFHPDPSMAKSAYYQIPTPALTGQEYPVQSLDNERSQQDKAQESHGLYSSFHGRDNPDVASASPNGVIACSPATFHGKLSGIVPFAQLDEPVSAHGVSHPASASGLHGISFPSIVKIRTEPQAFSAGLASESSSATNVPQYSPFFPNVQANNPTAQISRSNTRLISALYQHQVEEMARHAKETFTAIGGIKDLPGSVRIYVTIQHTVARFKAVFPNEPSLAMFVDGLDGNATMRTVRSVNGLACRTCLTCGMTETAANKPHGIFNQNRQLYTLPRLVNHFKTAHVEGQQVSTDVQHSMSAPLYDWKHDMIELPENTLISDLVHAPGMTDQKLALIARALPNAFQSPLPIVQGAASGPCPAPSPSSFVHEDTDESSQSYSGAYVPPPQTLHLDSLAEDEYDPQKPAFLGKMVQYKPHQSDKSACPSGSANGQLFSHWNSHHHPPTSASSGDIGRISPPTSSQQKLALKENRIRKVQVEKLERGNGVETLAGFDHLVNLEDPRDTTDYNKGFHGSGWNWRNESREHSSRSNDEFKTTKKADTTQGLLSYEVSLRQKRYSRKPATSFGKVDDGSNQRLSADTSVLRRIESFGEDGIHEEQKTHLRNLPAKQVLVRNGGGSPVEHRPLSRSPQYEDDQTYVLYPSTGLPYYGGYRRVIMNGTEPRSRSPSVQLRRIPQRREMLISQQSADFDTLLYRTRSPVEEDRRDTGSRNGSSSLRKNRRPLQVASYDDQSHLRYEHMDQIDLEQQDQQRVEYVPVRDQDEDAIQSPRYIIRNPIDRSARPEYVHYEQLGEPYLLYESNGQLIHFRQPECQDDEALAEEYIP